MELIAIRIPEEMKKKLEVLAREDHRSLSNLVRLILIQWLEKHEKESENK
ncbi:MAG: ribbon-helix-helix protein, CopG family [Deltaproteobacteria bacterium]|nr:ribbon-helix-helix protein, CopG family [Deltaproteobacteria bacterium]MBW2007758.1 ribbon-helix-helix protein, CopG family [Deltaproteobacteria bacterium]MBW2101551.1 ribbon-helix-helix protein, CopG family [Deltaproteobacteria bacterium]MBW2347167.1 ribbon-helix-helix protein, CopG family [Deltaproteobacteria bacterium]